MPPSRPEHLAILGLSAGASPREVRRAFRRLVLDLHPDRRGGDPRAADRFLGVLDAYDAVLGRARPPRARRSTRVRSHRPPPMPGPFVCPRCQESYGAPGECPRCDLSVAPLGARAAPPRDPAVDAMLAALEAARPSVLAQVLAPRVPVAAISALLASGALALAIHGPVATMLIGYGLVLLAGESLARPAV